MAPTDGSAANVRISAGVSSATVAPSRLDVPTTCPPPLRTRASTRSARLASTEADGIGDLPNARKRLVIVPNCHVQELITETHSDNWVNVTGVRVWQNGSSVDVMLAPPRNGGKSAVVIALGTIETTRVEGERPAS